MFVMSIALHIKDIRNQLPENVGLIAVSKYQPVEAIEEAYNAGQRIFGENKAQECSEKYPALPHDIQWHFIGHLQTNKVKVIAPFVSLIHSIDSIRILTEVNKEALKNQRVIDCLLQFHIATEETKFGLSWEEAVALLENPDLTTLKNVRITGVMGMASFVDDMNLVRKEFKTLKSTFDQLKSNYFSESSWFREVSMGMTHDYKIAIEEGSTLVRIGTAIFGDR